MLKSRCVAMCVRALINDRVLKSDKRRAVDAGGDWLRFVWLFFIFPVGVSPLGKPAGRRISPMVVFSNGGAAPRELRGAEMLAVDSPLLIPRPMALGYRDAPLTRESQLNYRRLRVKTTSCVIFVGS